MRGDYYISGTIWGYDMGVIIMGVERDKGGR